jgi:hypothetical protein
LAQQAERTIKAKATESIEVPAWWKVNKTPSRPPQDSRWAFEIEYQDVISTPAIVYSMSNGGGGGGNWADRSELHRIGGQNDKQWKTAVVPAAWSLIYVPAGKKSITLLIRTDEELPVGKITLRQGTDADQTRWEAETRAWVKHIQAPKAEKAIAYPHSKPQESAAPAQPMTVFVRNYLTQVYHNSAPQKSELGVSLKLRMATNEYEPAAFGVYAGDKGLKNVTYSITPLKNEGQELACQVELRTAEYGLVPIRKQTPKGAPAEFDHAYYPQRLWPMFPVDIAANQSHWFWIVVKTEAGKSKPGKYTGTITVKSDGATAKLPVEVEVLDLKLLTMDEAGLLMGGCVKGLLPFHEMQILREYNHNMINLWSANVGARLSKGDNNTLKIDFTDLGEWMRGARKSGVEAVVWFLGGDPYRYPDSLHIERQVYAAVYGSDAKFLETMNKEKGKILEEVKPLYKQWIREIHQQAAKDNWPELIFTPFDEPAKWAREARGAGPWIKPHFKEACALIREAWSKGRIYASIHHAVTGLPFMEDIDVFSTNAIHQDGELGDKVRAAGKTFWQYSATDPAGHPNRARYTFGWYYAVFDSRGSLEWAYNWYNGDSFDNSKRSQWGYGWTGPWSVVPSSYLMGLREAWDDRRYIETLRKLAKKKNVDLKPFFVELRKQVLHQRGEGGTDTISNFFEVSKDDEALEAFRTMVIEKIQSLSQGR